MNKNFIEKVLTESCCILYADSKYLINESANERSIVSRMLPYLKAKFPEYAVDSEYNREGEVGDRQVKRGVDGSAILPDLIIHEYGPRGRNLVAVEVKGYWNRESREKDEKKLRSIQLKHGYEFTYRIELGRDAAELIEVTSE